jgi:hypothetical protein
VTYGILIPSIIALGIVGNVLNLLVLNQPNMKGTAYIYMRGKPTPLHSKSIQGLICTYWYWLFDLVGK